MENKLFTPQEIADKLKIKKNTVYELIKRGELHGTKIGKQIRVSQQDIDTYLNQSETIDYPSMSEKPTLSGSTESSVLKRDYLKYSNGLVISGHEPLLDFLCSQINVHPGGLPTLRSHVGSYDSLYSLYFNKIHVAAVHLWDSEQNSYNIPYIKHLLPGVDTVVLHFVKRIQGFYVQKGNPKNIKTFKDLIKRDVRFVNRELGSGTRILIDGHIKQKKIDCDLIRGYKDEILSHFASAATVSANNADVAVGCASVLSQFAALDFVPIQTESYDLVFLKRDFDKPVFQSILDILGSKAFRDYISQIYGYDISDMGNYTFI